MQSGSHELVGRSTGAEQPRRYKLKLWQQPARARLCSYKEENDTIDRRPIDPPPVVEMQAFDTNLTEILDSTSFFIRASIVYPDPEGDDYAAVKTPTGAEAAAGDVIQTPERLLALDGLPGSVVVFAKLNVRVPGTFRLKFTLYETSDSGIAQITYTVSEPFVVYSPKLFRGMAESTALTRHLAGQGYKVKLRTDTSIGRQSNSRKRSTPNLAWEPPPDPPSRSLGIDDGLPSIRDISRLSYNPPPLSDLSAFSLDAPRIRYTRSLASLLEPTPGHLGRDDGTPYFVLPPLRNTNVE